MYMFNLSSDRDISVTDSSSRVNPPVNPLLLTIGQYCIPDNSWDYLEAKNIPSRVLSSWKSLELPFLRLLQEELTQLNTELDSISIDLSRVQNLGQLIAQVKTLPAHITRPGVYHVEYGEPNDDGERNTYWTRQANSKSYPYLSALAVYWEAKYSLQNSPDSPVGYYAQTKKAKASKAVLTAKSNIKKAQSELQSCQDANFVKERMSPLIATLAEAEKDLSAFDNFDGMAYLAQALESVELGTVFESLKEVPSLIDFKVE